MKSENKYVALNEPGPSFNFTLSLSLHILSFFVIASDLLDSFEIRQSALRQDLFN